MSGVTLRVDGREITVEAGTTVLEAARRLGIEIPTLCHVPGYPPVASCFLCSVQVEGHSRLSPSCALPVSEGMRVTTDSADIRASRKTALELLLSDHAGDCVAPCSAGCPAGLDVSEFVHAIAAGHVDRSMEVLYDRLALPGALGRICPRLCERSCRRHEDGGEGLAIAALHRHAADRNGILAPRVEPRPGAPTGKRVAIVGAGPAGLAAAFHLRQQGHACTLYDAHPEPGGMLRYGIPAYRLPRAALDDEIGVVARLGAVFEMGRALGRDFDLDELRRANDAVFLAIGAQLSPGLRCDGEDLARSGLDVLHAVATGDDPALGRRVVVVGGGNTAMDVARTARRFGAECLVLYRRTRDAMPCLMEEVEGAEEEGVRFELLAAPERLERAASGDGLRLHAQRMRLGALDLSGRRRPEPIPGETFTVECDTVVAATGQSIDRALAHVSGLELTERGLRVDPATLATSLDGVFAGGDAVLGPDVAVRAVAAGRVASISIGQYLAGRHVTGPVEPVAVALRPIDDEERASILRGIERTARARTRTLPPERRLGGFDEIDLGLDDTRAVAEARRCLSCNCSDAAGCTLRRYATAYGADPARFAGARRRFERDDTHPEIRYEPGKCILCDACVRIATEADEPLGLSAVGRGFDVRVGVPFDRPLSEAVRAVARRCADACPTGALSLRSARACDLATRGACPLAPQR